MYNKTMKKISRLLVVLLLVSVLVVGCTKTGDNGGNGDGVTDIMFVVTGSLGGKTNNDDVYSALTDYANTVDGKVDTFECNMDTSLYETTLMQAADSGDYDLIVTGFGTMIEPLGNTAAKYPDQKFLIFDTKVDFEDDQNKNVISVQVLQNEGGFLAGALAALVTTSEAELANPEKVVGFVGAMESTAIIDFLVGYIEGVNYVDPATEVVFSFVGNHQDVAIAKEMAMQQFEASKADVVFAVGQNGLGVADAAKDANRYAIGVDYDYAAILEATDVAQAEKVLTSVVKDYYGMVSPILKKIADGTVEWGKHTYISHAEKGLFLVDNDYFQAITTAEVKDAYNAIVKDLADGKIVVSTAFNLSTDEINAIKDLAKPQN